MQQLQAPQRSGRPAAGGLSQLEKQLLDRVIDIGGGRPVSGGDRLHRTALGEQLQQLFFLGRQVRPLAGRPYQCLDDPRIQHRPAGRYGADGPKQLIAFRDSILQEVRVTGRALAQQRNRVVGLVILRQHDDPGSRVALAHLLGGLDPLALKGRRHPNIGYDHLRCRLLGTGHKPLVVSGHPDDLEIRGGTDQRPNALSDD